MDRRAILTFLSLVVAVHGGAGALPVHGQTIEPDREAIARRFVEAHHPELGALLERLKPMNPAEYAKAIDELAAVSRSLETMKARDPRRYELSLEIWKARSRVDLLTARLISRREPSSLLEQRLRDAVAAQVDAEARRLAHDRDLAAARLARLNENLGRLEDDREAVVSQRLERILRRHRSATPRPAAQAKSAEAAPTRSNRPHPAAGENP